MVKKTCITNINLTMSYNPLINMVGGAITILKNMKVNGKDYPMYYGKKNV